MNLSGADLRFNGRLAGVGAGAINALEEGDKSETGWNTEAERGFSIQVECFPPSHLELTSEIILQGHVASCGSALPAGSAFPHNL